MMIEFILQAITLFIISAIPFFAGWMANDGKLEDIWIPASLTAGAWCILMVLYLVFG